MPTLNDAKQYVEVERVDAPSVTLLIKHKKLKSYISMGWRITRMYKVAPIAVLLKYGFKK